MNWYKQAQINKFAREKIRTRADQILEEGLNQSQQHLHDNITDAGEMLDAMILEGGNDVGARIFTIKLTPEQQSRLIRGNEPGEVILQESIPPSQIHLGWGGEGDDIYYHCTFDEIIGYKQAQLELWQMSARGPEYANLDIDTLDRMAFGFSRKDIKRINPKNLQIKWKQDMDNVIEEQKASGLSKEEWANQIDLSEPIEVIFEDGVFKIDDGHHRYYATLIRGGLANVVVEIKDNPWMFAVERALKENKPVPQEVLKEYELV